MQECSWLWRRVPPLQLSSEADVAVHRLFYSSVPKRAQPQPLPLPWLTFASAQARPHRRPPPQLTSRPNNRANAFLAAISRPADVAPMLKRARFQAPIIPAVFQKCRSIAVIAHMPPTQAPRLMCVCVSDDQRGWLAEAGNAKDFRQGHTQDL